MTKETKSILQHKFNVLHFYSRLSDIIGRKKAAKFCRLYEACTRRFFYVFVTKEKLMFK